MCQKVFDDEWKLSAHKKSHTDYPFDKCDKTFNHEGTRTRHKRAVHEQLRIYCHFYNKNKKEQDDKNEDDAIEDANIED